MPTFVDDDLGTRLAISDYLVEVCGYSVRRLLTVEKRWIWLRLSHLMVTDVVMPRMNGYELVRRVRQHPGFRLLPVISCQDETRLRNGFKVTRPEPISISPSHLSWRGQRFVSWSDHRSYRSEYRLSLRRVYTLQCCAKH